MKCLKNRSIFHVSDHGLEVVCHYAMLCRSDYQFPAICLDLCALKLPRSRHYFEATICVDFQTILSHWWLDRSEVKDRKKNRSHFQRTERICCTVVQFYPWFKFHFPLFWGMVMYDNEVKTEENKF